MELAVQENGELLPPENIEQQEEIQQPVYEQGYGVGQMPPPLQQGYGYSQPMTINTDASFMKFLFSYRKEVVEPLRLVWAGYFYDIDKCQWIKPEKFFPIMNERGISWGISYIETYINPVYVTTNLNLESRNYIMRSVAKDTMNTLCVRYKEFGLHKTNIKRIKNEIEHKILAILQGAMNDGFRRFFQSTHQVSEQTINDKRQQQDDRGGFFSGIGKLMKRNKSQYDDYENRM